MNREEERSVIDTRHVARTRGLVFFRLEGKRVDVDTRRIGDVRMVLVGLYEVEVRALAFRESVVTVELEFGGGDRVGGAI